MQGAFEIIGGPTGQGRRTDEERTRVRRDSRARGHEGIFWRPFSARNARRYMLAAERYDCQGRMAARADRSGRKNGPLGSVALDVLRELLRLIDYRSGQLDPALTTLAQRTGHSVGGVVAALKRLRVHGFTDWLRRYEPTGNTGRGPQVQQTSNAYRLTLPPRAEALLPADPPTPADFAQARAEKAAELRRMEEQAFSLSPLGSSFAKWGASIEAKAARERLALVAASKMQERDSNH